MRTKITDGDLLFIHIPNNMNQENIDKVGKLISSWLKDKGLTNVDANLVPSANPTITVECLSVNDAFESEVLKS